jgi:hypothetical protein
LQQICNFLDLEFEPCMLEFYRSQAHGELDTPEGKHHRLLTQPATTERIGRYRSTFSLSQIALIERCLGDEMRQLGYPTRSTGAERFTPAETAALAAGMKLYDQMHSGVFRSRLRRGGKVKVDAYQWFGNALARVPWRRVAVSSKDWEARLRRLKGN